MGMGMGMRGKGGRRAYGIAGSAASR
jgi:hypothetical protein